MTTNLIDKSALIQRLRQSRMDDIDWSNEARMGYQLGRNSLVDLLLVEIACGDLDVRV